MNQNMQITALDWIIIFLFFAISLGIGIYVSNPPVKAPMNIFFQEEVCLGGF